MLIVSTLKRSRAGWMWCILALYRMQWSSLDSFVEQFVSQSISPGFNHHLMSYWPTFAIIINLACWTDIFPILWSYFHLFYGAARTFGNPNTILIHGITFHTKVLYWPSNSRFSAPADLKDITVVESESKSLILQFISSSTSSLDKTKMPK